MDSRYITLFTGAPYHTPRVNAANLIIIHDFEAPVGQTFAQTIQYLTSIRPPALQSSVHYAVSGSGTIVQMVTENEIAWHAGNAAYNARSIGIEHSQYAGVPPYYPDELLKASAKLVADICTRKGIPADRAHIIGHNEVPDPANPQLFGGASHHTDPRGWNWLYYMQLVQGYMIPPAPVPASNPIPPNPSSGVVAASWVGKHWLGLDIDGYPHKPVLQETIEGRVYLTQYFQKSVFALDGNGTVTRTNAGANLYQMKYPNGQLLHGICSMTYRLYI